MSNAENEELKGPDLAQGVPAEHLKEGEPLLGHAHDQQVMLVRHEGEVFALGATCTHYGGPLHEGLTACGTVRCPWHHAHFSLRDGSAGGPALDAIPTFEVTENNGVISVGKEKDAKKASTSAKGPDSIVIIGAGAAGSACAETLRKLGYKGDVTLLAGDEPWPVDRPNLSKDYLAGEAKAEWLPVREPEFYDEIDVTFLQVAATSIDRDENVVELDNGDQLPYDALVLATGASARRLDIPGADLDFVWTLRTLEDAQGLSNAIDNASTAVVIGASFIGLETAASMTKRGLKVTVVGREDVPLENPMGKQLGSTIQAVHEANGVVFRLGESPARIEKGGVVLESGDTLKADIVVLGVGASPRVELAEQADMKVDDGVIVDAKFRTSDDAIYAVGDIARFPMHGGSARIEHWAVAQRQGQAVARALLGGDANAGVPFFWSAHFDVTISYVGHAEDYDTIDIAGSLEDHDATIAYRKDGKICAVATLGRDMASLKAEFAMETGDDALLEALLTV